MDGGGTFSGFGRWHWATALASTTGAAIALHFMGRVWWCEAGDWALWSGDIASRHNSQHLVDPYSFTHLLHGILFFAVLHLTLGRRTQIATRLALTLAAESFWEALENTPMIIDRYRDATIAFGYYGDSVANSLGDILFCAVGFLWAARVPVRISVATVILVEGLLLILIRDSLALNILMLIWPLDAVRQWQAGG